MNCQSCSRLNGDGVLFCEYCGTDLRTGAASAMSARPLGQAPLPSAADVAQMGRSILNSLTLGEKLVAAGSLAVAFGFFLPFLTTPDLGELAALLNRGGAALPEGSISLFGATKMLGAIYFILFAGVGSGVLFYFGRNTAPGKRLLINGFQVMIGSLVGPGWIALLLFVPFIQSIAGFGYWVVSVGFCAIAAGGLVAIGQVGKRLA